nr:uncharacterized protein At4g17910 isoform X2 [Ipomoea trifida]
MPIEAADQQVSPRRRPLHQPCSATADGDEAQLCSETATATIPAPRPRVRDQPYSTSPPPRPALLRHRDHPAPPPRLPTTGQWQQTEHWDFLAFSQFITSYPFTIFRFVSNLSGSSMLELFSLTAVLSIVILLQRAFGFNSQTEALSKKDDNDNGFLRTKNLAKYIAMLSLDFLYIVVPFILYTTVLADWTYINTTIVALLVLLCILAGRFGSFFQEDGVQSLRQNISSYRVSLVGTYSDNLFRAVAFAFKSIVCWKITRFYRICSFVLANSLVSRQARGISTLKISNSLRSASPLIFLGFARLISTSSVDYQVHVGEYGVHWNFFFTLAGVAILTSIINVPPNYCGILGLLILLGYQVLLLLGLNEYLLSDKRGADLISQNKEGIFSIFGKLLTYILDRHVERVSRRMCNLAYVTLVLAQNLQDQSVLQPCNRQIALPWVLGIIMLSRHKLSALEEAFDQNLLASFLLANVLTGLVNLSVDTLFVSSVSALAILQVYAFVLSLAVGFAKFYGIKFKFW